jgi:hypothetical protein
LNAITAVGALATLGGAGATMDTGVLGSIMSETVGVCVLFSFPSLSV